MLVTEIIIIMLVIIPKTLIMMITIDKRWTLLKEDNVAEDDCKAGNKYGKDDGNVVEKDGNDDRDDVEDDGIDKGDCREHPALAKLERDSVNPLMDRVFLILLIKIIFFIIHFIIRPSGDLSHVLPPAIPGPL